MENKTRTLQQFVRTQSLGIFLFFFCLLISLTGFAAPRRLIIALDGVSYRDVMALQEGIITTNHFGRQIHRQAFQTFFPVSRNVSTFPSVSDVAWTDILGDRPLPGYQRTYFNISSNQQVALNGVTSTMEYEQQMNWQLQSGFRRAQGYLFPGKGFRIETRELIKNFLADQSDTENFYALIRTTDDAQHTSGDIFPILCNLDEKLKELRATYRAREGRDLEILILSDHGNNHAGSGKRVPIRSFLKRAGYRITSAINGPKDIVLPTAGMESWAEIHNIPVETEKLAGLLCHLEGVDILTAQDPNKANHFLVMNDQGERADIEWNPARNSFRYSPQSGDPIHYQQVVDSLVQNHQLDADGFATADVWMAATLRHQYPLALERIVRGHTKVAVNPATILISLKNDYIHSGWWVKAGSLLVKMGGTHGGLDDLNSDGIVLSSFAPTHDTSTSRIANLFDGFAGIHNNVSQKNIAQSELPSAAEFSQKPLPPLGPGNFTAN